MVTHRHPGAPAANLVGLYLRGSLATGDFRPESSDIDLLAVTESLVSDESIVPVGSTYTRRWRNWITLLPIV